MKPSSRIEYRITNIEHRMTNIEDSTERTKEYHEQRKLKIFKADMRYPEPQDSGYERFNVFFCKEI